MYAVIETGGKQYRVQEGDIISVEKLGLIEGETYDFDKVLMIADEAGIKTGAPYVEGATVKASIEFAVFNARTDTAAQMISSPSSA